MKEKPWAYLEWKNQIFLASYERREGEPYSATWCLIQGIWQREPKNALSIVRSRIFTSEEATPMNQGVVKVSAKRMTTEVEELPFSADDSSVVNVTDDATAARKAATEACVTPSGKMAAPGLLSARGPVSAPSTLSAKEWALELRENVDRTSNGPRYELDRAVGAVLTDAEDRPILGATNRNALNRTLHAEVNLLQGYWDRFQTPLPEGARIYVTLQCCRMCAALIHSCAGNQIAVFYGEKDPGPMARNTALQLAGLERQW